MKNFDLLNWKIIFVMIVMFVIVAAFVIFIEAGEDTVPSSSALYAASTPEEKNGAENQPETVASPSLVNNLQTIRLLEETINRLETLQSISADIKLDLYLFGGNCKGKGKYEELTSRSRYNNSPQTPADGQKERSGYASQLTPLEWTRYRMHVKMLPDSSELELATDDNSMEIVCDIENIWTYTRIEGTRQLRNIRLDELANQLNRLSPQERKVLAQNGVERPCGANGLPGLGGISGMLKQIMVGYCFPAPPENTAFNGGKFAVWKIVGQMKPERLDDLKKFLVGNDPETRNVLLHSIPTHVEIYIGKQTPFPYRVRYICQVDPVKDVRSTLFSMDFNPVYENDTTLQPKNFIYRPSTLSESRGAVNYLKKLIPDIEL